MKLKENIWFNYTQLVCLIQLFFMRSLELNTGTGLILGTILFCSLPFIILGAVLLVMELYIKTFKLPEKVVKNKVYTCLFFYLLPSTIIVTAYWIIFCFEGIFSHLGKTCLDWLQLISNLYYFWI